MKATGVDTDDRSACEDNTVCQAPFQRSRRAANLQPEFMARSMPVLRALRRARQHCDVVFRTTDGAEFWVHRFVLAASYAGCGAFFSGSEHRTGFLVESVTEHEDIATPPLSEADESDLSSEMLHLLIDLAYQVPIHKRVSLRNVREVLDVAEELDVATVWHHCLQLLGRDLEQENFVYTCRLALSKGYGMLSIKAFRYIVRNINKVWATNSEFQSLMPDEPRSVLYNDELQAPNEVECNFGAFLEWITGNVEDRQGHLLRLLPLIRFAFCSRADMVKVESDSLVRASEEALSVLAVIKRTLSQGPVNDGYWKTRPDLPERRWLKPRVPKDVLFMVGGWTGGATNHLLKYNHRSNPWLLQPHKKTHQRACLGVFMLDGLIYSVGVFDGHDCYHTVVTVDVSRHNWTSRSNMQVARCYVSVGVFQGHGRLRRGDPPTAHDAKRTQWEMVASMHAVRRDACAARRPRDASSRSILLDSVQCYDPSFDASSYLMSMSSPRSGLQALVHDDTTYMPGGFDGAFRLGTAESMDARRGHWSELTSMTFPRSNFTAVLLEGSTYVAGQVDDTMTVSFVERCDIHAHKSHDDPTLRITCSAAAGCVYQNIPNARRWLCLEAASYELSKENPKKPSSFPLYCLQRLASSQSRVFTMAHRHQVPLLR